MLYRTQVKTTTRTYEGKNRESARLSRSFGGTKGGIFDQHILQYQH